MPYNHNYYSYNTDNNYFCLYYLPHRTLKLSQNTRKHLVVLIENWHISSYVPFEIYLQLLQLAQKYHNNYYMTCIGYHAYGALSSLEIIS